MVADDSRQPPAVGQVARWHVVVRLLHWALAGAIAFNLVRDDGDEVHRTIGYWAVGFVVTRLIWAFIAHGQGRLAALRPSLKATQRYVQALVHGSTVRPHGHDPLALWMVWLLWAFVLLLGLTGWLSRTDAFWGEDTVHDLHALLANMLLMAVVVHVGAVAIMSWRWGINLVAGMVFGHSRNTRGFDQKK